VRDSLRRLLEAVRSPGSGTSSWSSPATTFTPLVAHAGGRASATRREVGANPHPVNPPPVNPTARQPTSPQPADQPNVQSRPLTGPITIPAPAQPIKRRSPGNEGSSRPYAVAPGHHARRADHPLRSRCSARTVRLAQGAHEEDDEELLRSSRQGRRP
jgi:hypothetical protein